MCGIVGIVGQDNVAPELYNALTVLQHRGQDSAGIITCNKGEINIRRSSGYVRSVFRKSHLERLRGKFGIGHVRYPTAGGSSSAHSQPFYVNSPYGVCLGHNGNLVNVDELRRLVTDQDKRHLNTDSDSELMLNVLAHELQQPNKSKLQADEVFGAVSKLHKRCIGAYACVSLISDHGLLGFRDPNGIRPLILGSRRIKIKGEEKNEYILASESSVLSVLGYSIVSDVEPGEAIYIDKNGVLHRRQCAENTKLTPCIFEHVYFARPDSIMDDIHLYKTRLRQGEYLAQKIKRTWPDFDFDVIVPIPDTSRVAAQALGETLSVNVREGLMKNRYVGRTFIMPNQEERVDSVRQKLNVIELEFLNKKVLLVDDSIVRGTTSTSIIKMVRNAGAKKVYIASAAPPVRFPNVYGIDMPSPELFVAHNKDEAGIARELGADKVIYQDLDDLIKSSGIGNPKVEEFECSVFSGKYLVGNIDQAYLEKLAIKRSEEEKIKEQRKQANRLHYDDDDDEVA